MVDEPESSTATKRATTVRELPRSAAVYALYGGRDQSLYVAYVGIADNLRRRIIQHLVTRDSSIASRTSAVRLEPDLVTEVHWWEHKLFADERRYLEAAELIAFGILEPALRSRGGILKAAESLTKEPSFRAIMTALLNRDQPTGRLVVPNIEMALARISDLERRIKHIEVHAKAK